MKKHFQFLFPALLVLALASCKKDNSNNCDPQGDCFSAKIDGAQFNSDNVTGTAIFGAVNIGATFGTTTVQAFQVALSNTATGTYDLSTPTDAIVDYYPSALNGEVYSSSSGSLTIDSHDIAAKKIKGTFSFEGTNPASGATISVTAGMFELTYQ